MPDFRGAGSLGGYPYAYDACILRYFAAIAVGMWLAIDDERVARRRLVVVALAVPSVALHRRSPEPTRRRSRSSCTGSRS